MTRTPDFVSDSAMNLVDNAVIQYDADSCSWKYTVLVDSTSCWSIRSCIDANFVKWLIRATQWVRRDGVTLKSEMWYINANINSSWTSPNLTIGGTTHNLSTLLSNMQFWFSNGWGWFLVGQNSDVQFLWLDGLRTVVAWSVLSVWLPLGRTDWDILSRNGTTAEWVAPLDACCEKIQTCMRPITDGLQSQIDNINSWGGAGTNTYVNTMSLNNTTNVLTLTRTDAVSLTVDFSTIIAASTDDVVNWGSVTSATNLRLTTVSWGFVDIDMSPLQDNDNQTLSFNSGTNILSISGGNTVDLSSIVWGWVDDFLTAVGITTWTSELVFTRNSGATITVDMETTIKDFGDLVRVTAADTTGSYLFGAVWNTTTVVTNNDGTVKKRVNTPTWDETLQFVVDLTTYNGNTNFIGNHIQTGNTTTTGVTTLGTDLVYTDTNTTGTQNFDSSYIANYVWSDINYTGGTVDYDGTTVGYNAVTQNYTGDNITNLAAWASHTYNLDWTVNNNLWATYEENNVYTDGATINNDWTLTVVNAPTYVENTDWGTFNITNQTTNYNDVPVLIDCTATQLFDTAYTYPVDTQFVELVVSYDAVSETIRFTPNSGTQSFTVNGEQLSIVAWATDYTYSIVSGTVWLRAITTSCHYNGVSTINQNNVITNNDWGVTNNTNTTTTNIWVTEVYDANSDVTYEWDVTFEWDIVVTGQVVGANRAHVEEFIATAAQTTFTLANTPASAWLVRVSSRSSLYAKQGVTRDFTVAGNDIVLNIPATVWDVITVQYIESLGTPLAIPSITTGVTASMTDTSLVVADANATTTSVITWTAQTSTAWFIEIIPWAWSFTINSSASETGVVFNYVITN